MRCLKTCLIFCFILTVLACSEKPSPNTLIIGTMAGPESDVMSVAQTVAETRYGLTIKIIEFNDYNLPNSALQDGTLDANIFQHGPYLKEAIQAHHYNFEVAGKTFLYPMAIYSNKIHALQDLSPGAIIAIPNDPSNESRALSLLQSAKLIKLKNTHASTPFDIANNPKHYQFRELDSAQITRVLPDVDIAVINTNFAIPAGLNPLHNGLFIENKTSPYANLIVIRKDSSKKNQIMQFIAAIHSPEARAKAEEVFADAAIPAW